MRPLLVLLAFLPLAACERATTAEDPDPAVLAPESSEAVVAQEAPAYEEAPREEARRQETRRLEAPAEGPLGEEASPRATPRAAPSAWEQPPILHPRPVGRDEIEPGAVDRPFIPPVDGKHAALLQSQKDRDRAQTDAEQAATADGPRAEAADAKPKPADSFREEVVLPGSVVM